MSGMDTMPFHLVLFALDIIVCGGLYFWLRFRRNKGNVSAKVSPEIPAGVSSAVFRFEQALFVQNTPVRPPFFLWDIGGVMLFGSIGLGGFAFFSRLIFTDYVQKNIYHFNVGQCIVEGAALHGTLCCFITFILLRMNRRRWCSCFALLCALIIAGLGCDMLYLEPYLLKVEYYDIVSEKVKQPIRIVFVADIQTDNIGSHERRTLQLIQQQNADLIILGGDYIQTYGGIREQKEKKLPEQFRQLFLDYPLTAPLGVYAIAGNIGTKKGDTELFQGTSVEFIPVTTLFPNLGEGKECGPIDMILLSTGDASGSISKRKLPKTENFVVMAGHYPNYAVDGFTYISKSNPGKKAPHLPGYRSAETAPDLMLAGHTHGCQIVFPFYGTIPWITDPHVRQIPPQFRLGFHTYPNGSHLLVSRGSGMERGWAPRVRFCCPSEISVIDIVPKPKQPQK